MLSNVETALKPDLLLRNYTASFTLCLLYLKWNKDVTQQVRSQRNHLPLDIKSFFRFEKDNIRIGTKKTGKEIFFRGRKEEEKD